MRYFLYARKSSEAEDKQALSLFDQVREVKALAAQRNLQIIEIYQESHSAKVGGKRKIFNEMMRRLQRGEANGILCWKVNRLARNMTDGGVIADLLRPGKLEHILSKCDGEFTSTTPVVMLTTFFSIGTQYSRELATDTIRGMETKVSMGWAPRRAPIGYLNDKAGVIGRRRIYPDPVLFPKIRKLWDFFVHKEIPFYEVLRLSWSMGITGRFSKRPISVSTLRNLFSNVFYTGLFNWHGERRQGKHKPMITLEEFDKAQILLHKNAGEKRHRHHFTYRGLMRCGVCGGSITAERHKKPSGKVFAYYRCTRYKLPDCGQQVVPEREIKRQIDSLLVKGCTIREMKQRGIKLLLNDGLIVVPQFDETIWVPEKQKLNSFSSRKFRSF